MGWVREKYTVIIDPYTRFSVDISYFKMYNVELGQWYKYQKCLKSHFFK